MSMKFSPRRIGKLQLAKLNLPKSPKMIVTSFARANLRTKMMRRMNMSHGKIVPNLKASKGTNYIV